MFQSHFARVSTHEGAFSSSLGCLGSLLPNIQPVKYRGAFCVVEILLPRMKYTHELVDTHGGALLPERAPEACYIGAKSLVCIGLYNCMNAQWFSHLTAKTSKQLIR